MDKIPTLNNYPVLTSTNWNNYRKIYTEEQIKLWWQKIIIEGTDYEKYENEYHKHLKHQGSYTCLNFNEKMIVKYLLHLISLPKNKEQEQRELFKFYLFAQPTFTHQENNLTTPYFTKQEIDDWEKQNHFIHYWNLEMFKQHEFKELWLWLQQNLEQHHLSLGNTKIRPQVMTIINAILSSKPLNLRDWTKYLTWLLTLPNYKPYSKEWNKIIKINLPHKINNYLPPYHLPKTLKIDFDISPYLINEQGWGKYGK